jgi:hypothetical protein
MSPLVILAVPALACLLALLYRAAPDSPYHDRRK